MKNIYLVSYDISNDRKRTRISKILEQFGYERIQYSVFTGLTPPHRNKILWQKLEWITDQKNYPLDRIICFAISKTAFRNMKIIGNFDGDIDYLLGLKHTEIL